MNSKFKLLILSSIVILSGCTTLSPEVVVNPSEVSVVDALKSVGDGLSSLKTSLDNNKIVTGLLVDEVVLTLNLTSKADDKSVLGVDVSKVVGLDTFKLDSTKYALGERGSTLKITLKNKATTDIKNKNVPMTPLTPDVESDEFREPCPDILMENN